MPLPKLTVELLEQSRNPKIRKMFTNKEAGREIDAFVKQHHLHLAVSNKASGGPDGAEITGDVTGLKKFIEMYLSEDSERGVYSLALPKSS
jgi:hypothetical protein